MGVWRNVMRGTEPGRGHVLARQFERQLPRVDADHRRVGKGPAERHGEGTHARPDVEDAGVVPADPGARDQLGDDRGAGTLTLEDLGIGVVPASGADRIVDEVDGLPEHRGGVADHGRAFPLVEVGAQVRRADEIHDAVELSGYLRIARLAGRIQLEPGDERGQGLRLR